MIRNSFDRFLNKQRFESYWKKNFNVFVSERVQEAIADLVEDDDDEAYGHGSDADGMDEDDDDDDYHE